MIFVRNFSIKFVIFASSDVSNSLPIVCTCEKY
jgi:hypothetical protein